MIEFVGSPLNLENHIRGCHGNHAFSRSPYQSNFEKNFVSHSEGPTEQFGMNLKGPWECRIDLTLTPPLGL